MNYKNIKMKKGINNMNKKYKLNIIPSPHDSRDWIVNSVFSPNVKLPEKLDHRQNLQPIRDQGTQGSCAAQTGACIKEWQEKIDVEFDEWMSPQFIYNLREYDGEGMTCRGLMSILQKIGSVPERLFPYGETMSEPSEELKNKAENYRIKNYAKVNTIEELKTSLTKSGPALIAVPVYNYGKRMWKSTSEFNQLLGGHAMTIAGYNKDGFIIRNSWGKDWGDNGYTTFPYEDWGWQWEVWTAVDDNSDKPDFSDGIESWWYYFTKWVNKHKTVIIFSLMASVMLIKFIIDKLF